MRFVRGFAYFSLCALCLGAGTMTKVFERYPLLWEGLRQSSSMPFFLRKADPFDGRDELFVLILGCDEDRYYGGKTVLRHYARTDTIQLVRLDFKKKSIGMMQIPRDTEVDVPGYRKGKINGLFPAGGKEATTRAVEMLTGIRPDRVIVLNYAAIEKMIDAVGGVDVYVPRKMDYDDVRGDLHVHLTPGVQRLDGRGALGYLRFRKDSDLFRGKRQQDFLVAFKQKITGPELGAMAIPRLSSLAMEVVNGGVTAEEFVALGKFAQQVPPTRVRHGVLPIVEGRGTFLEPQLAEVPKALEEAGLRDAPPRAVSAVR
jgi:LCP family protein required for cell wall assembly